MKAFTVIATIMGFMCLLVVVAFMASGKDRSPSVDIDALRDVVANAPAAPAQWKVIDTSDEFTDEVGCQASSPTLRTGVYRYAILSVDNVGDAWVNLGYFNNSGSEHTVQVRFDQEPAQTIWINEWSGTKGFSFSELTHTNRYLSKGSFIEQLRSKSQVRILLRYYNEGQVVLAFSLAGADAAIGQVLNGCKS